ncbi:unnamed protein product [Rhodiola kirilowii]
MASKLLSGCSSALLFVAVTLILNAYSGECALQMNYYAKSCPNAEAIIKKAVIELYYEHGNTAVSWLRNLFHDCIVKGCDASFLLEGIQSEQKSERSFGMRNFKYVSKIKAAVENACPNKVSCADIVALSARDGIVMLGGPRVQMKTGRRDSTQSYLSLLDHFIPHHNASTSTVLSVFASAGLTVEESVALLGAHSVGRVHCTNLVQRLYPTVDPALDPDFAKYLKGRCPTPNPDPKAVLYSRFDLETTMIIDNFYYKNLLKNKGLLVIDQQLLSDPRTSPYVQKFAKDNGYFYAQFAKAILKLSENNPLTGAQGEIRKDCRLLFVVLLLHFHSGQCGELQYDYYSETCPKVEKIIKEEVVKIHETIGTTAESWLRILFHDCMVKSCDASLLLKTVGNITSELEADRSFGIRNLKYLEQIKNAVERECPETVSCADIMAIAARDAIALRGGPVIKMKTGRRDSTESYFDEVDTLIPDINASTTFVLSRFKSIGLDVEETVAILGAHSIGRTHCRNIVQRLYPKVDPTLDPDYAQYLIQHRCTTKIPSPTEVQYARNDRKTPYILDNAYYENLLANKGLLLVDQQLASDNRTSEYVQKFADDNDYFLETCPRAEEIIKNELVTIRDKIGTVAESFLRYLFHDCMVKGCDASLLLKSNGIKSEQAAELSFGLRNFRYLEAIKEAVERECPSTVSCADILALAARDNGRTTIPMKTGRRDSKKSYYDLVDQFINNHSDSTSSVLSHFGSVGLDVEETVAVLGAHSVGRTHCKNIVGRLYPIVDPTMNPAYANYLKTKRCPTPIPDKKNQKYARNDRGTPYILDNYYYKNLLAHKGLLKVDQELASDSRTASFVKHFAANNDYFVEVFSRAVLKLSENNPLTGNAGEVRKNCQFVNSK